MKLFDIFKIKPEESIQFTPEEMLEKKYQELIDSNGMSWSMNSTSKRRWYPNWWHEDIHIEWKINWTDICIRWIVRLYLWDNYEVYALNVQNTIVGIMNGNSLSDHVVLKLYNQIIKNENDRLESIAMQESIKKKEEEELKRREQDRLYFEEYKRISWMGNEFYPVFKTIDEIQSIWKKQEQLLNEWKKNTDKIYSLRESIYNDQQ